MIALIGVLVTAIMAAVYIWQPTFLVFLNQKTYDTLFRFVGQAAPSGRVAVVYVDEASVARYGQWPWPHYRLARLLGGIADLGASAVAVDFLLGEPDRTSLSVVRRDMARELGVNFQVEGLPERFQDNDRILAEALSRGPFVLGMKFLFGSAAPPDKEPCVLKPPAVVIRAQGSQPPPPAPLVPGRRRAVQHPGGGPGGGEPGLHERGPGRRRGPAPGPPADRVPGPAVPQPGSGGLFAAAGPKAGDSAP